MNSPTTFPTVLRELLRTHQAFLSYAASHVHKLDLTLPQFDIIITLGNTLDMPYKKLGEETLITKGTLTGVISRLAWRIKDSFNDLPRKRMDAARLFA